MSTNAWDEMRRAKEDQFFDEKNKGALKRLAEKRNEKPRLSPITGEPMEQVALHGVIIARCPSTGGIWLDMGELAQLIEAWKIVEDCKSAGGKSDKEENWITNFFKSLTGDAP